MIRLLLYLLVLVALAGAAGTVGYRVMEAEFARPGPSAEARVILLPKGAGLGTIAELLAYEGAIESPLLFRLAVRIEGRARVLKAGEYEIPAGASGRAIMALLVEGKTVVHRLTVPEGLTSAEIIGLLAAAEALDGDSGPLPPQGSLLPETYHFTRGDDRAALVERMRRDMAEALAGLWAERAEGLPLASSEEAIVLASIVEKETGVAAERPLIAGVFYNRLAKGMPLQSDPTVVYALTGGAGPLGRALTRADLKVDSPYNTYLAAGLPPGPIANPGRAALEAVLKPAETDALYFVADGSGGHAFAATLEEHNRNVAKWRKAQADAQAE
ncbi:MAG: endolytic transglycosylase MltG [Alphaproteobacteria bacterium]